MKGRAFTIVYKGVVNRLETKAFVSKAYNPKDPIAKQPPFIPVNAVWDTGATNSVITKEVADRLQIKPTGQTVVEHANGTSYTNTYLINIGLPNNVIFPTLRVSEGILGGFDMLIGMDIISSGDFAISCSQGTTKFTFQVPSTHNFDFVAESSATPAITKPVVKDKKIGRNDPCPCGSGKKYKHCCGKGL